MRVKRGVVAKARHNKILKLAKGYRGRNRTTIKTAKQAVMKAGLHAYRDRRLKKRTFRALWIVRLNAALRAKGTTYSKFIHQMGKQGVLLNRKALAELAATEPAAFSALVDKINGAEKIAPAKATGTKHAAPVRKAPTPKKDAAVTVKKAPAKKATPAKKAPAKKKV